MPGVRLNELNEYRFRYQVRLEPRDINYAGHMSNDALVSLLGRARAEMFHSLGLSELDLGDSKTGIIMSDLVINYRAGAFMFDELLVETHVGEIKDKGFRMFQRVTKDRMLVALAETGINTFSYTSREVAPIPGTFLGKLDPDGP